MAIFSGGAIGLCLGIPIQAKERETDGVSAAVRMHIFIKFDVLYEYGLWQLKTNRIVISKITDYKSR